MRDRIEAEAGMNPLSWTEPLGGVNRYVRKYDWRGIFNQPHVWITEDGRVALIKDLDTDHLRNLIPWAIERARGWPMMRRYPEALPLIAALRAELARRPT